jgi:DNA repair protein RecN (Recombination protein N)
MLERLRIRNFALIDKAEIRFSKGLNVLTGETGAGKSILLGALSVVLGERITDELFRSDKDSLEVEASLGTQKIELPDWVALDEDLLVILRKALKARRAQNFVNQHQITQTALAELGDGLVDIHGQHQHQLLLKVSTHGRFLDAYGGLVELRKRYATKLAEYKELVNRIKKLKNDLARRHKQRDFLAFQLSEIEKLEPKPGEVEALKKEQELLASAERRAEMASRLIELISEQDASILEGLALAGQMLKDLLVFDPSMQETLKSLQDAQIAAEDVWRTMVRYRSSIEYSPERLEEVNERLFAFEKLCRKHNVDDEGLIKLTSELKTRLSSIELDAEEITRLEKQEEKIREQVIRLACELSQARARTKQDFEQSVEEQLESLAMPKAKLIVEFLRTEDPEGLFEENGVHYRLSEDGLEETQFLFSANPGEAPKPLARIASGGELSRIMLALKTVLVDSDQIPVLVFDEIDVGIGGATAETIGKRLKELAGKKQILLVTHLPQIARYADRHFQVIKKIEKGRTITRIKELDEKGRVAELARMLGGEEITDTVRAHAEELRQRHK